MSEPASDERKLLVKMIDLKELTLVYEIGLRAEMFTDSKSSNVFTYMIKYWLDSRMLAAPTRAVLKEEFPAVELPESVEESTEYLVDRLRRWWVAKEGQDVLKRALNTLPEDPCFAISTLWKEAYDIAEATEPRLARTDMALTGEDRWQAYLRKGQQSVMGMTLGLDELDAHTQGVRPGELAVLAGYTKTGKTWLLALAALQARRKGFTPLVMSLEQGVDELAERIDAIWSGVSYTALLKAELDLRERELFAAARAEIAALGSLLIEKPQRGERTVKSMVNRCRRVGADYLIIDQLSFMDGDRDYRGERLMTQKHTDIIFDLKDEINRESVGRVPTLLAVQFNRETQKDKTTGGRGDLHNFAHSSMIEQTADLCLGMWRTAEARANNTMKVGVIGARRCDNRDFTLAWHLDQRTEFRVR